MSIYKKGINDIKIAREIEYSMTNNCGIYMNQTVIGENTTPYHGLFIRQGENNKDEIYLSKVIEQVKIDGKVYNINDINTNEEKIGGVEYLEKSSRYPLPSMEYNINDLVKVEKKYVFDTDANILCINYDIENLSKSSCNIKVLPLVTKRGLFTTKRESMLKLNSDTVPNGAVQLSRRGPSRGQPPPPPLPSFPPPSSPQQEQRQQLQKGRKQRNHERTNNRIK